MFRAPCPTPRRALPLTLALMVAGLLLPAASPAVTAVQTRNGWTVAMTGPDSVADALATGAPTTLVVGGGDTATLGGRPAAAPQTLTANVDLGDFGCGGTEQTAATAPCLPARSSFQRDQLLGTDGLLLQAKNKKAVPTIVAQLTYGSSDCCNFLAGYWRDGSGWSTQSLNSGAMLPKITPTGRIAIGNVDFERLDWPFSRHQSYITWNTLVPRKGWVDVTTAKDHRSQIGILQRRITRWKPSAARKDDVQSARAVVIAHETAIGGSRKRTAATLMKSYTRIYGADSAAALTKALAGV